MSGEDVPSAHEKVVLGIYMACKAVDLFTFEALAQSAREAQADNSRRLALPG